MTKQNALYLAKRLEEHVKWRPRLLTRGDRMRNAPSVLMKECEQISGQTFRPRDYLGAAKALRAIAEA